MSDFFRKISKKIRALSQKRSKEPAQPADRRASPRLICSKPVIWEVGSISGEGELRELSFSGLRIRTQRAILAGKMIRIRPLSDSDSAPLSSDVAIGSVVYSRSRGEGFDVGVELINPERMSRFAWLSQLKIASTSSSPIPVVLPKGKPHLRIVK